MLVRRNGFASKGGIAYNKYKYSTVESATSYILLNYIESIMFQLICQYTDSQHCNVEKGMTAQTRVDVLMYQWSNNTCRNDD